MSNRKVDQIIADTLNRNRARMQRTNEAAADVSNVEELVAITPDEFKTALLSAGWDAERLAKRWGLSKRRVNQIIADADRPRYYDDAIRALSYEFQGSQKGKR